LVSSGVEVVFGGSSTVGDEFGLFVVVVAIRPEAAGVLTEIEPFERVQRRDMSFFELGVGILLNTGGLEVVRVRILPMDVSRVSRTVSDTVFGGVRRRISVL
jgi:hypothetical protein